MEQTPGQERRSKDAFPQSRTPYHQQHQELFASSHQHLLELLSRSYTSLDTLYEEHLRTIVLLVNLASVAHLPCGIYRLPAERQFSFDWSHLVIIDLPGGQLCWPIPDQKLSYFRDIPLYKGAWRGFTRLDVLWHLLLYPQLPGTSYRTEKIPSVPFPSR